MKIRLTSSLALLGGLLAVCGPLWAHHGSAAYQTKVVELKAATVTKYVWSNPHKPTPAEIALCRPFLASEITGLKQLKMIMALGSIAHGSVLAALGQRASRHPFKHGAIHEMPGGLLLADSYHCSRYNTNTRRLTTEMFEAVVGELRRRLGGGAQPSAVPRP